MDIIEIKNCFKYLCPKIWDELQGTENQNVRFCSTCNKNVYFAEDEKHALKLSSQDKCVAIKVFNEFGEMDVLMGDMSDMGFVNDIDFEL